MNTILAAVLGSMHADMARMDSVAMNLANLQTPGYRRDLVSALGFGARVDAGGLLGEQPPATVVIHTDQRAGMLKPTSQPLDLALSGAGWFEVMTDQGVAYTRQGDFRLDERGRLVTQQGQPVMGTGGEIQLVQGTAAIDSAGRVFEGARGSAPSSGATATPVAQLKVVHLDPAAPVQRLGDGLVRIEGEASLAPEGSFQVRQGFLEQSNVSHMHEMVRLLETLRHMESMQKVAVGYDEMLGTSVRKLGENP